MLMLMLMLLLLVVLLILLLLLYLSFRIYTPQVHFFSRCLAPPSLTLLCLDAIVLMQLQYLHQHHNNNASALYLHTTCIFLYIPLSAFLYSSCDPPNTPNGSKKIAKLLFLMFYHLFHVERKFTIVTAQKVIKIKFHIYYIFF